ncbi:MAG: AAA family ATPase [Spirochaetes bacterium]|nr:AAA family ATPase [Spirochaetota bacterium]
MPGSEDAPRIIAVCGKGGVGKTSVSAGIVRTLVNRGAGKVLAIDADPAVGLAAALRVKVSATVDDIRNRLIDRLRSGEREDRKDLISHLDYEVFGALSEQSGLAFLAIGRPETDGCYCQVNEILKDIIGSIAGNFDFVVIDGEAGIEQVNRRVMEKVTHLILVSDPSAKGLAVAKTIMDVSKRAVAYERAGLVLNRVRGNSELDRLAAPAGLEIIGWVPEDDAIREADISGKCILDIPDCPALTAIEKSLLSFGVIV